MCTEAAAAAAGGITCPPRCTPSHVVNRIDGVNTVTGLSWLDQSYVIDKLWRFFSESFRFRVLGTLLCGFYVSILCVTLSLTVLGLLLEAA